MMQGSPTELLPDCDSPSRKPPKFSAKAAVIVLLSVWYFVPLVHLFTRVEIPGLTTARGALLLLPIVLTSMYCAYRVCFMEMEWLCISPAENKTQIHRAVASVAKLLLKLVIVAFIC